MKKQVTVLVALFWMLSYSLVAQIRTPEVKVENTNQGYTGIGVTIPQEMLHVDGSIRMKVTEQNNSSSTAYGLTAQYSNQSFIGSVLKVLI